MKKYEIKVRGDFYNTMDNIADTFDSLGIKDYGIMSTEFFVSARDTVQEARDILALVEYDTYSIVEYDTEDEEYERKVEPTTLSFNMMNDAIRIIENDPNVIKKIIHKEAILDGITVKGSANDRYEIYIGAEPTEYGNDTYGVCIIDEFDVMISYTRDSNVTNIIVDGVRIV